MPSAEKLQVSRSSRSGGYSWTSGRPSLLFHRTAEGGRSPVAVTKTATSPGPLSVSSPRPTRPVTSARSTPRVLSATRGNPSAPAAGSVQTASPGSAGNGWCGGWTVSAAAGTCRAASAGPYRTGPSGSLVSVNPAESDEPSSLAWSSTDPVASSTGGSVAS